MNLDTRFIHSTAAVPDHRADGINPAAGRRGRNTTAHAAPAKEETSWRRVRSVLATLSRLMSSQVSLGGCTEKSTGKKEKRAEDETKREREKSMPR
jgi:hypothetical protein